MQPAGGGIGKHPGRGLHEGGAIIIIGGGGAICCGIIGICCPHPGGGGPQPSGIWGIHPAPMQPMGGCIGMQPGCGMHGFWATGISIVGSHHGGDASHPIGNCG